MEEEAKRRPQALRLLTHPGVGPITALATDVFLGDAHRFATGNQVASYIGMIPCEHSSGKRQRLGKLSKQGNGLLRYLYAPTARQLSATGPADRTAVRSARCLLDRALILATTSRSAKGLTR